jgi:hypothetical protein
LQRAPANRRSVIQAWIFNDQGRWEEAIEMIRSLPNPPAELRSLELRAFGEI